MSHIVEIETQVKDIAAVDAACRRLQLEPPLHGSAQLFSGTASGVIVKLPGWKYPAVFDIESGQAKYDNYGGTWGNQVELDRFLQAYACECTKLQTRRQGHSVTEQSLADGSIKLTINVGGAA